MPTSRRGSPRTATPRGTNRLCEANLFFAYGDVAVDDRDLPAVDAWVAARPASFAPWAARAIALENAGYRARGGRSAAKTPRENFERMAALHARALADADRGDRDRPHCIRCPTARRSRYFARAIAPRTRGVRAAALFEQDDPAS